MALIVTPHPDLSRLLTELGHTTLLTANPADAVHADLVVLPWVNRPVSGAAWCKQVRERSQSLPILVVTRTEKETLSALEAGANDVMRHPMQQPLLRARCRNLLVASAPRVAPLPAPEEALRVLDTLPEAVLAVDLQGVIRVMNRAAERLLGYTAAELVGQVNLSELFAGPTDSARMDLEMRNSADLSITERRVRLRSADGERLPVVVSMSRHQDAQGLPIGSVLCMRDDRDQAALSERLNNATNQLLATEKRLSTLAAAVGAAHEINQPLASAMGLLELLLMRPELSQDSRDKLERAWTQLERIADQVRTLTQTSQPTPWSVRPLR